MQLYTQEFYETVVKQKLAPGGVFVTQSGPAGVLSATQVRPPHAACCTCPVWSGQEPRLRGPSLAVRQLLSNLQVYTAINHTLQSVFPIVIPFVQHLPSFADCWVNVGGPLRSRAVAVFLFWVELLA
jgi:thermospermine synthase